MAGSKRYYETTFIVDSILEDEKVDAIIEKYTSFLTKNECEITKTEKWGRRKFTYSIKGRQTGHYVSIEFSSGPGVISKLERTYHLDENILRFLNVSFDKKMLAERNAYFTKKEELMREREAASKAMEQSAEQVSAETAPAAAELPAVAVNENQAEARTV